MSNHGFIQASLTIITIVTICVAASYYAFGQSKHQISTPSDFFNALFVHDCTWFVCALIVSALLVGIIGSVYPNLIPLQGPTYHDTSIPLHAETYTNYDTGRNSIIPKLNSSSELTNIIRSPFELVNDVNNPIDENYVLKQFLQTIQMNDQHATQLIIKPIQPGFNYKIRVSVGVPSQFLFIRKLLESNVIRLFDLRYTTHPADKTPIKLTSSTDGNVIRTREMNGIIWYTFEKNNILKLPDDATHVHWYVGTACKQFQIPTSIYWCGFEMLNHYEFLPELPVSRSLTSFFEAFKGPRSMTVRGEWYDLSGHLHHAQFSQKNVRPSYTDDGGLNLHDRMIGPPSSVLSKHVTHSTSRENVGPFTLMIMYAKVSNPNDRHQRLLRVHADHFDSDDGDSNPPSYLMDVMIDHHSNKMQIKQQHKKGESKGNANWSTSSIPIDLHTDVGVYTIVHDGSKNIHLYANSVKTDTHLNWFDRNYQLNQNRHLIVNEANTQLSTLYALVTFNRALSAMEVRRLTKYLMRRYNEVDDDRGVSSHSVSSQEETTIPSSELEKGFTELKSQIKNQQIHDDAPISNNSNDDQNTMQNMVYGEEEGSESNDDQSSLYSDSDAMLKLGTKVIHRQTNEEAMVSREPYTYENIRYIDITYMNGSKINAQTRIVDVQLHAAEKWRNSTDTDRAITNVPNPGDSYASSSSLSNGTTNTQPLANESDQSDMNSQLQKTSISNDTSTSQPRANQGDIDEQNDQVQNTNDNNTSPYKYRSALSDDEYEALPLTERRHVLHDTLWNRTYRDLPPALNLNQ